jgi:putative ABC transport system substrate-binding protein
MVKFSASATEGMVMQRREFMALVGGAAAAWPLAARAQQSKKLPTIGYFSANTSAVASPWTAAFVQRLRELGWIEDRTVAILYRYGEGTTEHTQAFVSEFVRLKVDVIVVHGEQNILAARQATSTIAIVFPLSSDPIGSGFVASLARPGGNLTGLSIQSTDLAGKRIELLREVVPGLHRFAILGNMASPANLLEINEVNAAARTLGMETSMLDVGRADEIVPAFKTLKVPLDALYVCASPFSNTNRIRINTLAAAARLPSMHGFREAVEAGALMSYGANFPDLFHRAAEFVDKILRGAKPANIPVEQPTRFDLVVNLTTAAALDLTIPETFLVRADEIIE